MSTNKINRGEEMLLDLKDSARRRILCGLRWDPMQAASKGSEATNREIAARGGMTTAHDLDLLCLTFDKYGRFIEGVTGEEGHRTGDSGNIYHTGDVIDGADSLDDEQISLELFNMSSKVDQVFFIAEVQSAHKFGEVASPEIRIANAADDHDFAQSFLGRGDGAQADAYVFGRIRRHPQGWTFRYIGEYLDGSQVKDWAEALSYHIEAEKGTDATGKKRPPAPGKGQTVKLHYSLEARQRVVCGLNWDPADEDPGTAERLKNLGKNVDTFDLDLACVMYDAEGEAVDGVSAQASETVDSSGKVYHSGDDTSGEGDNVDDEAISVELKDLPAYIHHIVFLSEIQSLHTFDEVFNPSMRIADGKSNEDQLEAPLQGPNSEGKNAYVFARMSRAEEGWNLTFIDEFCRGEEIEDWIEHLKRYLG